MLYTPEAHQQPVDSGVAGLTVSALRYYREARACGWRAEPAFEAATNYMLAQSYVYDARKASDPRTIRVCMDRAKKHAAHAIAIADEEQPLETRPRRGVPPSFRTASRYPEGFAEAEQFDDA